MLEIQMGTFIHITKTYLNYNNFQCSTAIYCMLGSLLMFPQNIAEFSQLNLNFLQVLHVLWSSIVLPFSSTSQLHFNTFQPLICPSYFQIASCTFISIKKKYLHMNKAILDLAHVSTNIQRAVRIIIFEKCFN